MDEFIIDAFTREGNNTNLEVNNLNVDCITSTNNNFTLDSNGNLTVNSINANNIMGTGLLNYIYPVGSIYISVNSTNPGLLFGGNWESFGLGRTLVGVDTTQTEFNEVSKTGGNKNVQLRAWIGNIDSDTGKMGYIYTGAVPGQSNTNGYAYRNLTNYYHGQMGFNHSTYVSDTSGNLIISRLQPYITVYMWKRVS